MSWFNDFIDSTKRIVLLDATFDRIDDVAALTNSTLGDLDGEVDDLDKRVVRLEALKPQDEEVSSLKERVIRLEEARDTAKPLLEEIVKLETARDADLARIEAALTQLSAERSRLDADVERHITRLQRETPQLPSTQPTDN